MSANRANASAVQRRSVNQPQQQQQQQQQPQQQRQNTGNQRTPQRNQPPPPPPQQQAKQTPKLSVSDAMALVSLRLGRVETFINAMPTLDQLHSNTTEQEQPFDTNTRMVDEAVFTSIVSRLEKVEKNPNTSPSLNTDIDDKINLLNSEIVKINTLSSLLDSIKVEFDMSKILLLNFQTNIQVLNQKLDSVIEVQSQQQTLLQQLQEQNKEQLQVIEDEPDKSIDNDNNDNNDNNDEIVSTDLKEMI